MNQKLQNLFFLFLLGTIGVKAQPVITAAGFNPVIGDSYKMQETKVLDSIPKVSGKDLVWDFSNLIDSGSTSLLSFVSPKGQSGSDSFTNADITLVSSEVSS